MGKTRHPRSRIAFPEVRVCLSWGCRMEMWTQFPFLIAWDTAGIWNRSWVITARRELQSQVIIDNSLSNVLRSWYFLIIQSWIWMIAIIINKQRSQAWLSYFYIGMSSVKLTIFKNEALTLDLYEPMSLSYHRYKLFNGSAQPRWPEWRQMQVTLGFFLLLFCGFVLFWDTISL